MAVPPLLYTEHRSTHKKTVSQMQETYCDMALTFCIASRTDTAMKENDKLTVDLTHPRVPRHSPSDLKKLQASS